MINCFAKSSLIALCIFLFAACDQNQPEEKPSVTAPRQLHLQGELEEKNLSLGQHVFIRIFKQSNELEIWLKSGDAYELFKRYEICSYSGTLGPKLREGDRQSPEGFYSVNKSQLNPNSNYHLSFNLGFPNLYDRVHGRTGSFLMVHGGCASIGCYAMTDEGIEEIYSIVEAALNNGQSTFQVHIFPFRLTDQNLSGYVTSQWYSFWANLKTGYDYFEVNRVPPTVKIENKTYTFETP